MKISFIIGFVFLTISQFIFAQSGAVVLDFNHHQNNLLLGKLTQSATSVHTGFKPLVVQQLDSLSTDSVLYKASTDKLLPRSWYKSWFWRKLRYEDFATATTEKYNIRVNPLLRYEIGTEKVLNEKLLINTRGVKVDGSIGSKFAFSTSFYENQATYPQYIDTFAYQFGVIPGQGSPKLFGAQGHDFSRAEGYISFAPYKWLSLQLGQGRNFIGEGYRSMILSDNTFPYPYLRFNLGSGKWQLQALYTEFTDFLDKSKEGRVWHYSYHYKRHASMTYLSYKPTTKLELGLFEGIMWLTTDTAKSIYNKIPPSFFSPIPLLRTLNYGLQEDQNVLLGLQGKYSPFRNLNIY
ncbi:MAG: hypothetical protein RIS47_230, partial [Bacteroidota bacterium]